MFYLLLYAHIQLIITALYSYWPFQIFFFLYHLTFTTLLADSADDKFIIFFLFFPENRIWHFMQICLHLFSFKKNGDSLHKMSNPVFWGKYFKLLSAKFFTQSAKC